MRPRTVRAPSPIYVAILAGWAPARDTGVMEQGEEGGARQEQEEGSSSWPGRQDILQTQEHCLSSHTCLESWAHEYLAALWDLSQLHMHFWESNICSGPQSEDVRRHTQRQGERWCSSSTWRQVYNIHSYSSSTLYQTLTWVPLTLYRTTWWEIILGGLLGRQVPPGWSRHKPKQISSDC